ncbi:hypothetical protein ACTI_84130 [Actinoplanes sp. OR16]|uniref:hypothetical protein n=1 Tax=Actinoplanes sp. OR16 TaxID=946334 RepID=UPI000F70C682|nr:hypothetical protein [Actinoplanes sp. OR16]BBH71728.1 hypothetical protein ACTI_84130 [Actinoplanes sp. OR16]
MIGEILISLAVVIWLFHYTVRPEREAMRTVMAFEAEQGVITAEGPGSGAPDHRSDGDGGSEGM